MTNPKVCPDWNVSKLKDCCRLQGGYAFKSSDYADSGTPIVRISNIQYLKVDVGGAVYVRSIDRYPEEFQVVNGNILIAMSGATTGKIGRYRLQQASLLNQRVGKFVPESALDNDFLFHLLQAEHVEAQILQDAVGGAQPNISPSDILDVEFTLPPLPEQKKIARILSSVDRKLALIDQQITTTKTLKKGLMQKLFSQGVGTQDADGQWQPHTEFQDTELGRIPKGWCSSTVGKHVSKVGSGVTPKGGSASYLSSGIPLIRSQNVLMGKLELTDVAYISEEQHQKMKGSMLEPNDVLLNITGASIGRCCLLANEIEVANVNQHVCIIRTVSDLLPSYTAYFLASDYGQSQIWSLQAGGNREGLNFQQIRSFKIPVPHVTEQKQISNILSSVDNKLDHLNSQKSQTQQLKKGLMQKLLTGQIRVKPDSQDV